MNISALVPVGPIDSMGYQYHSEFVLNRFRKQFKQVYIASSVTVQERLRQISFGLSITEPLEYNKIYSKNIITDVINRAIKKAIVDKVDYIVLLMINNYITEKSYIEMIKYIERLEKKDCDFGFYHNRRQFGHTICKRSELMPYVINLKKKNSLQIISDGISVNGNEIKWISGAFGSRGFEVTDLELTGTMSDFEYKVEYYIKHQSLQNKSKRIASFDIQKLQDLIKLQTKMISFDYSVKNIKNEENKSFVLYPSESIIENLKFNFSKRSFCLIITFWRLIRYKKYRKTFVKYLKTVI